MGIVARYKRGFYYHLLNIDDQFSYQAVASAVSTYQDRVTMTNVTEESFHKIKKAILYDNPEFFYWNEDSSVFSEGTIHLCYYTEDEEEASTCVTLLRDKRRQILNQLSGEETMSLKDMLERTYKYITETVGYAEEELQKPGCASWIYSIQGPLLKRRGVCLGIAQTVNYFCAALHIPALLVTGEAKVAGFTCNHGWNLIELDGSYYHLDITGEICEESGEGDKYYLLG